MGARVCSNGVACASNFSYAAPIQNMKLKTLDDGSVWALIFYHYTHSGNVLFTSVEEVLNTETLDKFSKLYMLRSDRFKSATDNKFEFMLCYPLESNEYNRWKQSNNPCDEYEGNIEYTIPTTNPDIMKGTVAGYEPISIAWDCNCWGGLARFNEDPTEIKSAYLTGSIATGNTWFFAIGGFRKWNNGIPSNSLTGTPGGVDKGTECVELWVRVDNTISANKVSFFSNCITANNLIEN